MASDSLSEQEIQFRKRARRRLVGAVALVLLMVTLLPMVLDDQEPAAPQQEIAISIPSQDGGDFSSRVVPAPEVPATDNAPAVAPAVPMASPIDPVSSPLPEPAAAETQPAPAVKPAAQVPVSPVVAKEPAATPAPSSAEPVKASTEQPAAPAKSGFSVQIGVYSDAAKVKQLQSRLKAQGVATYTEKLGTKIRLRSGPYPTRAAAEKVQENLKQMNMASMVVTNK